MFSKKPYVVSDDLLRAVDAFISEHYIEESEQLYSHTLVREAENRTYSEPARLMFKEDEHSVLYKSESEPRSIPMPQAAATIAFKPGKKKPIAARLDDIVGNLDEPFSATLMRLIDSTGKKDSDIYNRANIDRRLFSKIRSNEHYAPSKSTVLAFAIALELTLEQTGDLLARAGFALSRSRKFDVIVEFFIHSRKYDIFEINQVLYNYDQPLLGG